MGNKREDYDESDMVYRVAALEAKIDRLVAVIEMGAARLVEHFSAAETEAIQSMPRRKPVLYIVGSD